MGLLPDRNQLSNPQQWTAFRSWLLGVWDSVKPFDDVPGLAQSAVDAAAAAAASEAQTSLSAAGAAAAAEEARAAANATGVIAIRTTYALALADVAGFAEDAYVEVIADETLDAPYTGSRTRYQVVDGALVYRVNMDQWRLDLGNPEKGTRIVYQAQGGLTNPIARTSAEKFSDSVCLRDAVDLSSADATTAINVAIRDGIVGGFGIDLADGGTYNVSNVVLNDYTQAAPVSGDYQREHIRSFRGYGGLHAAPVFAAIAGTTGSVVRGCNSAGVSVGGFRVDAKSLCDGVDLSWVGGGQAGGVAPSNRSHISDIWVSNFVDVGVNLDQCHDTDISRINTVAGSGTDPVAVSLRGAGGYLALRDSTLYGGKLLMSCQNGSITSTVLSGLELTGGSYNHVGIRACHFIDLAARGYAIYSSAIGNATRAISVEDSAFMTTGMTTGYIQGRFWVGGHFKNCLFLGGVITSDIIAAAGTGARPVFIFENCSFNTAPTFDETNGIYVFVNCRNASGARFSGSTAAIPPDHALSYLLVGQTSKVANELATVSGTGWVHLAPAVAGLLPGLTQGLSIGWNRSGGLGEAAFAVHGGSGSAPGFQFGDVTSGAWVLLAKLTAGSFAPGVDATTALGTSALRWTQVYASNTTISSSDARLKTELRDISDAEIAAFRAIARLPMVWQWLARTEVEGDDARLHAGPTVQAAIEVMTDQGLDWTRYAAFCHDEWPAQAAQTTDIPVVTRNIPATFDADGSMLTAAYTETVQEAQTIVTQEAIEGGDRYSFRKSELLWWCLRAESAWAEQLHTRLDNIATRLAALESAGA